MEAAGAAKRIRETFGLVVGVPDSSLTFLGPIWQQPGEDASVCTNEGSAVALAAGWALGSGRCALVCMQNSGLLNALNPLTSLTHASVQSVPLVLLIGMRGWAGDEPQHEAVGRATTSLLRTADIPFRTTCASDLSDVVSTLGLAHQQAVASNTVTAVLVEAGAARPPTPPATGGRALEDWTSRDAVRLVLDTAPSGSIVVGSTGFNSRLVHEYRTDHPGRFDEFVYCVGAMGHACSVAQGLAVARPDVPVICVDGDGSALMHLGAVLLPTALTVPNYRHVIVNNGSHESVGGGDTLGSRFSFSALGHDLGWPTGVFRGPTTPDVLTALGRLLNATGPVLVEMLTRPAGVGPPARPRPPFVRTRTTSHRFR
ncbi:thiamine pyrophosphate-dependent enzyme [Micromonospora sp. NPDC049801]|uniref:thiamine pyrophosphate-dependent enzyme n=1 Tax=Micromonospora sp. NPDC049801 TaxID=3155509 RepID=UPI0033DD860A